ncbi:MAG TPA: 3,4-dihydroxy-2-butanone-4-phosphate synthase [Candidatus Spyradosoma merdigallinarum]|uniref:3,4-dihydroxy-2-butanone 4-phosphate synthase n=1 Tax=Candidatus Spyradosoma merdigallinarum TaxID=2840950 RepID=A0A9D1NIS5_9BACT|nr:3,4-dihydroxy-2-butanone-4-phosphate synthase [Candidatus Spyradosoma merdigallinarum]
MEENLLEQFGDARSRVECAVASLRSGRGALVVDDENRENEGDLIFAAETLTEEQVAALIRDCSGIICVCITEEKARQLDLPMMVPDNTSRYGTAFTISVDARENVTTGVSAADRLEAVRVVAADDSTRADLAAPGHMFPLVARGNGVLERPGHTEATVDLARLAGFRPCGVLCELTNPDGTMARLPQVAAYAREHALPLVSIRDLVAYRKGEI